MSALTDRIAREHVIVWGHHGWACAACGWEALPQTGSHEASRIHVAEVTEAAVREQVARDLEDRRRGAGLFYGDFRAGWLHGMDAAVETVRGGVA